MRGCEHFVIRDKNSRAQAIGTYKALLRKRRQSNPFCFHNNDRWLDATKDVAKLLAIARAIVGPQKQHEQQENQLGRSHESVCLFRNHCSVSNISAPSATVFLSQSMVLMEQGTVFRISNQTF